MAQAFAELWKKFGLRYKTHPWHGISAGENAPEIVTSFIEIVPTDHVKYEIDKDSGEIFVDRFMGTAMHYPCNYGYVPNTLCDDGDAADVLVVTPLPLITGCVIRCRPVGVLKMSDESGQDSKVVAVPVDKLTPLYKDVKSTDDLPAQLINQITHFFEHYKDLEEGKWVKVDGWGDTDAARQEIINAVAMFEAKK